MSLESGRKFGYYASLINVILPIVAIVSCSHFFYRYNCLWRHRNR